MSELPEIWRAEFAAAAVVPEQGLCGVRRFVYTHGLLTHLSFSGFTYQYAARYCYPSAADARRALAAWDGQGDPPGDWIKEKVSGRSNPGAT